MSKTAHTTTRYANLITKRQMETLRGVIDAKQQTKANEKPSAKAALEKEKPSKKTS